MKAPSLQKDPFPVNNGLFYYQFERGLMLAEVFGRQVRVLRRLVAPNSLTLNPQQYSYSLRFMVQVTGFRARVQGVSARIQSISFRLWIVEVEELGFTVWDVELYEPSAHARGGLEPQGAHPLTARST